MKTIAVLQSNYIPWKGYFDIIHDVDEFIFYDEVQFTRQDWRSRNKIMTRDGAQWLSVPTGTNIGRTIREVRLLDSRWQKKHYETLRNTYSRAPYYKQYAQLLGDIYLAHSWAGLSELNQYGIRALSELLGITAKFSESEQYASHGQKHDKLLSLVQSAGADIYVSGHAAKEYIIERDYLSAGIQVVWKDYGGYPEYKQLYEPFDHYVSILDLLFHTGEDAPWYIWGWREETRGRKPVSL